MPQLATVEETLLKGATANGFTGELWTLARISVVVEGLWSSLKAVELANLCGPTLAAVIDQTHRGIDRIRHTPHLAYSFCVGPACRSHDRRGTEAGTRDYATVAG